MIPICEEWEGLIPSGRLEAKFLVLWAYIDDSGNKDGDLLILSALIADSPYWFWLACEWNKVIERKNAELAAAGRPTISRYHASDCSSRRGEFEGWDTQNDQIPFVKELLSIVEKFPMNVIAYSVELADVTANYPAAKANPRALAHTMLLHYIMQRTVEKVLSTNDSPIGIIHDRSSYNAVLLNTFDALRDEPTFEKGKLFTSITPMSSADCVPLQVADLIAFENFKEAERRKAERARRKSLDVIMDWPQFGGSFFGFTAETIADYTAYLERVPSGTRTRLLDAACVPRKSRRRK